MRDEGGDSNVALCLSPSPIGRGVGVRVGSWVNVSCKSRSP